MINGTSGMVFPPFIDESSVLFIFSAELCRSVYLTYEQDVEFLGVPGLRFIVDLDVLEDPTINLANKCFCLSDGTCLKAGVLDVSACLGVPVVMSAPHFYSGSEEYYNTSVIEGMAPDENNHQTFIDIEPLTGIILNAAKKLQVNLNLKPIDNYPSFQNVSQMIFPIFWVNESASLSQELADDLYNKVIMPQRAVAIGSWVAVGVGLFTLLVVGAVALREYRRKGFRPF
ncbi:unnamed protein product [Darwinula stevensoni]|uniref:Uncharacterized protein n=1 Tax=Darwinula stevensoni TaxID=69355 RepID=A0A7R9FT79_9CRUS|nr:unnamed protein product [Darwinula stevensoni]CAG0904878.1 unnamed protein product [Darwinula stevensoni]